MKKTRRGMRNKNALKAFTIMSDNVRGIKSKTASIQEIIETERPAIIGLSETKLKKGDGFKIPGYIVKRADRGGDRDGGGVMFAYKETFEHIIKVVREEKELAEMLWIRLNNNVVRARIGIVYMPQEETKSVAELKKIYRIVEEEIETALQQNQNLVIMGDFNCKIGATIPGNMEKITKGGRILLKIINKYNLCVLNSEKICSGKWTRIEGQEKSVLDYVIVKKEDKDLFTSMEVDEEKLYTPYTVEQTLTGSRIVYTDHCMIKVDAVMNVPTSKPPKRRKQLEKRKIEEFAEELAKERVSEIIDPNKIVESYTKWSEKVMEISDKFSTEKRPKKGRSKCNRLLIRSKRKITRELKSKGLDKDTIKTLKKRKQLIMEHLEGENMRERGRKIEATVQEVKEGGGVDSTTFWKVKSRLKGKNDNEIAAIIDEDGNKIEEPDEIKGVYMRYFSELLTKREGTSDTERNREDLVQSIVMHMETLCQEESPQETNEEDLKEIISKLDVKKARDRDNWSNEIVKRGGDEMFKSIKKIIDAVDENLSVPVDWNRMAIRATDKKGPKLRMTNKRGLFMTNIISKVYERTTKKRNQEVVKKKASPWQMGGVQKRCPTDNQFITYSVIERNTYLNKPTYIFYADAEKCFDKMWLEDAVIELWMQGTNIRDAVMIKKMNEEARIIIHTPVGDTEEIICHNIVRQGTVYGPQLCGVSMARVNDIGRDVVTMYGPKLIIRSTQFLDDVSSAGSPRAITNTIYNCNLLEDTKKMTFNNKNGKTEYTIVHPSKDNETITSCVKNGQILRVPEHKSVGIWIDERGTYMINIEKNMKRVPHMIATVKAEASGENMGKLAVQARLKLVDAVVTLSLLYGVENIPRLGKEEIKKLESMQHKILTKLLEVPNSTPYMGVLMETGMWTMEARINYRKLMLFHNIKNSDDGRVIKQILNVQEEEVRDTTWYADVERLMELYQITTQVTQVLKSSWKKEVKEKIKKLVELEIKEKCVESRKTRTVREEPHVIKQYLQDNAPKEASELLKTRLHMTKLTCNYGASSSNCPLCGYEGKVETEHFFGSCKRTMRLAEIYETTASDLKGSVDQLKKAKNHLKKVEVMMERYMPF